MEFQIANDRISPNVSNINKIIVEGDRILHVSDNYRKILTNEELDQILEDLIIKDGFIIDRERDKTLTLINPKDSETKFWIWLDESIMCRRISKYLGNVSDI